MTYRTEYDAVPDVRREAQEQWVVDPHFLDLQQGSGLPSAYLPRVIPGEQGPWRRVMALVLIVMFVSATAGGICLTYGPGDLLRILGS